MSDAQLLVTRLCELPLRLEGTPLEARVARLHRELGARGLRFRPHVWFSEEWFTPDGVPGFALPFYLAHPRLARLERRQMLEVEGGTQTECLRILRHEAGHAIDNAFHLHELDEYRRLFGPFTSRYPDWYRPRPHSRDYVLHLPAWYAQAHPAEDFAETFAVWLTPGSRWRSRYRTWPALRKLEFVDATMRRLADEAPPNTSRRRVREWYRIRAVLAEIYRERRSHYAFEWPPDYDRDLCRTFTPERGRSPRPTAARFLQRHRAELSREVADGTGAHRYAIDQLLVQMMKRSRELKLYLADDPEDARHKLLVALTAQTLNGVYAGQRIAL
jgi:hypothetical protein